MIKDAKTHLSKYFSNNIPTNHIIDQKLKSTGHHPVLNHWQRLQFEDKTMLGGRSINKNKKCNTIYGMPLKVIKIVEYD